MQNQGTWPRGTDMLKRSATVIVGNLHRSTTKDDLVRLFGQFADVVSVDMINDRSPSIPWGFALVELAEAEQAEAVCAKLNGCQLNGRCLEVRPAGKGGRIANALLTIILSAASTERKSIWVDLNKPGE